MFRSFSFVLVRQRPSRHTHFVLNAIRLFLTDFVVAGTVPRRHVDDECLSNARIVRAAVVRARQAIRRRPTKESSPSPRVVSAAEDRREKKNILLLHFARQPTGHTRRTSKGPVILATCSTRSIRVGCQRAGVLLATVWFDFNRITVVVRTYRTVVHRPR